MLEIYLYKSRMHSKLINTEIISLKHLLFYTNHSVISGPDSAQEIRCAFT